MSRRAIVRAPNPHMPLPVSAATRRDLFGTMGAMLLLSASEAGSTKAAELDGELLACCAEALAADDQCRAIGDEIGEFLLSDPRWERGFAEGENIMVAYHSGVTSATDLPARTPEGLRAKAALALRTMSSWEKDFPLVMSVLGDIVGRAG